MNSSIAKRIAGTKEQNRSIQVSMMALRILAAKRSKVQQ